MEHYKNSENQSIKDSTSTVTLKSNAFFKLMGCQKSDKRVKIEQFMDFYLTESINTETDERFRNSILEEWEINESEIDNYISESFLA
jgi:predicted P-loop ATPase